MLAHPAMNRWAILASSLRDEGLREENAELKGRLEKLEARGEELRIEDEG